MFVLIDNYDSFTYNLFHYFTELGAELKVYRNDALSASQVVAMKPQGIILSPGPCDPDRAGICLDLIKAATGIIPMFGVCLGLQSIGQAFGGKIKRAPKPMHGKTSFINHDGKGIFVDIPDRFTATRYHSLIVDDLPDVLEVTARTDDGLIMGLRHRHEKIYGVQFHPESIASEYGHEIIGNFLKIAGQNLKGDRS